MIRKLYERVKRLLGLGPKEIIYYSTPIVNLALPKSQRGLIYSGNSHQRRIARRKGEANANYR